MPRQPRPIADGLVYHALNRGNNRAAVFLTAADYLAFLEALGQTQKRYPFQLFCYCLPGSAAQGSATTGKPTIVSKG